MIRAAREQWRIPGLTVAVAAPGVELWSEGFGQADIENDVLATAQTVYRLGSISKLVTAAAVLQLAERGLPDLGVSSPFLHCLTQQIAESVLPS